MKKIKAEEYSKWDKNLYKELSPLEALRRLRDYENLPSRNPVLYLLEQENLPTYYKVIETALKENEELKTSYLNNLLNEKSKEYIYKKLKAFEIIKKHCKGHLNIDYDEEHEFYEIWVANEYKDVFVIASGQGKEEYELLKEMLL